LPQVFVAQLLVISQGRERGGAAAMGNWRNARICGLHLLTWAVIAVGAIVAVLAQRQRHLHSLYSWDSTIHFGWPMTLIGVPILPSGASWFVPQPPPPPPHEYQWQWPGVAFNAFFWTLVLFASAVVVERLLRSWQKPWQLSLAGMLWVVSVFAATLAITGQPYLPPVMRAFGYLGLTPGSNEHFPAYVRWPTYLGIACLLYVAADAVARLFTTILRRLPGKRMKQ
jgi:hypothetical protein